MGEEIKIIQEHIERHRMIQRLIHIVSNPTPSPEDIEEVRNLSEQYCNTAVTYSKSNP